MKKPIRVPMSERRPIFFPENITNSECLRRASYFSEEVAREQIRRRRMLREIYKPGLGFYKYCKIDKVFTEHVRGSANAVICCQFSPLKKFLSIGYDNGMIQVMSLAKNVSEVVNLGSAANRITSIKYPYSENCKVFYASSLNGNVYIIEGTPSMASTAIDLPWKSQALFHEPNNEINAMDVGEADDLFTAGKDATIRHYDVKSGKLIGTFSKHDAFDLTTTTQTKRHVKRICALKYANEEKLFVTGGWDNSIKVWDNRCPDYPVRDVFGYHINGDALDVMDKSVLIGHWTCKNGLHLLDLGSSKILKYILPNNRPVLYSGEFVSSVRFMRNLPSVAGTNLNGDVILVAGSGTCSLEIISIKENTVLHSAEENNSVLGIDSRDNLIAYGGYNKTFTMLSFQPTIKESFMNEKFSVDSDTPLSDSAKSLVPSSVDTSWKKMWGDFEKSLDNRPRESQLQPSEEERFMEFFLEEIKAQSGTGPKSLLGDKLSRYADLAEVKPDLSEAVELDKNVSSFGRVHYNTYDLLPNYNDCGFTSGNNCQNKFLEKYFNFFYDISTYIKAKI